MPRNRRQASKSLSNYIHKVLKIVHPDLRISKSALLFADEVTNDVTKRLIATAGVSARAAKKATLGFKHVQASTKVNLPFKLGRAACNEGKAAVRRFSGVAK